MRKYMLMAALVVAGFPLSSVSAREMSGYVVRTTMMRAGPDYDYPAVQRLRRDTDVTVHGCLRDWNWCDVSNRYDRGWVARRDIEVSYQGRRRYVGSSMGIFVLSFSFGNYWDNYYRSRPFYSQRPRWEQHYNNNYQQSWGPRSSAPNVTPQQLQPGMSGQRGGRPQGQAEPQSQYAPPVPQAVPVQHQRGNMQRQSAPAQQLEAPQDQGHQGRQNAPIDGNPGPTLAPGNQHGDQGGDRAGGRGNGRGEHTQDNANKDHKSRD